MFFIFLLDFVVVSWHLKTSGKITFDAGFVYSRQVLLFAFSQGLPVGIYAYAGPHGRCYLARHSELWLSSLANEVSVSRSSSVEWFQATKQESNTILRGRKDGDLTEPNREAFNGGFPPSTGPEMVHVSTEVVGNSNSKHVNTSKHPKT